MGSAINLSDRFYHYYSYKLMSTYLNNRNSAIYSALLKHGYSNFRLEIIEYCDPSNVIEREQYYLDLLNPEYNLFFFFFFKKKTKSQDHDSGAYNLN